MKKSVPNAFTLIELLVVISIMTIIGVVTISNYKSFGEDKSLKNAVLDVQSILRAAQTSATSGALCGSQSNATWQVEFASGGKNINRICSVASPPLITIKTKTLDGSIQVQSASGISGSCPTGVPFTVKFIALSGKMDFGANCKSLTITLKNTKTGSTQSLVIEQEGRIYGQ